MLLFDSVALRNWKYEEFNNPWTERKFTYQFTWLNLWPWKSCSSWPRRNRSKISTSAMIHSLWIKTAMNNSLNMSLVLNNQTFRVVEIFRKSQFSVNRIFSEHWNCQWIIFEWIKDNHITHLPDDFGSLTSLSELMLDKNELTHLPISFGHLKSLTWVDLCSNLIENLPENLYQLTNLEIFNLSKNFLEEIPVSIGSMKKLSILKVDQNKLLDLTPAVGDCINLTELVLNENLLTRTRSDTFFMVFIMQ